VIPAVFFIFAYMYIACQSSLGITNQHFPLKTHSQGHCSETFRQIVD
jgi:hypothetical protein